MALSFLSGSGSGSSVKFFDIRLDENYIVFRGNEHESASAHLTGTLVFCVTEPLTIKHVRLTLSGISRIRYAHSSFRPANITFLAGSSPARLQNIKYLTLIPFDGQELMADLSACSWSTASAAAVGYNSRTKKEVNFFEKVWTFRDPGKGKTETLTPDNYEYPFDVVLDGGLPESIEGLPESWIVYRFKAEIGRKYSKDVQIRKPLRIIRTLGPSALETAHEMSVENIWPNKIEYAIGTPTKAVIFGTSIQVNFRLVSLLKGLRIGLCTTEVLETHEFTIEQEGSTPERKRKDTRSIVMDQYTVDAEADPDILNEEAEGYQFSRYLELPKTLKSCLQDAEIHGIKIRHKLKFNVALHNPDGHVSELRATLPISLYISPSIAINENNDLVDQSPVASRLALENDLNNSAPPLYGQHQFDQYYSEMDHAGYRTPGTFSTPGTPFGSLSRNISSENLSSLIGQGGRQSIFEPGAANNQQVDGDISPAALQHRLQNLRVSGSGLAHSTLVTEDHHSDRSVGGTTSTRHPSNATGDYFDPDPNSSSLPHSQKMSPGPSPGLLPGESAPNSLPNGHLSRSGSTDLSRPNSGEDHGAHTPIPHYHEIEDLARTPSYRTAVRTPARTPYSSTDLPSYGAAVSSSIGQSPPAQPPAVYLRGVRQWN